MSFWAVWEEYDYETFRPVCFHSMKEAAEACAAERQAKNIHADYSVQEHALDSQEDHRALLPARRPTMPKADEAFDTITFEQHESTKVAQERLGVGWP